MVFKIYVELFETISRSIKFNYLNEIITINITSLAFYIKGCGQLSCADASKFTETALYKFSKWSLKYT